MTLGLRPCAAIPRYCRASLCCVECVRAKNESRVSGPGGRENIDLPAIEKCSDLAFGSTHSCRGRHYLWPDPATLHLDRREFVERRFVESNHRTQRPGDQVQLVLDHQIRWRQSVDWQWPAGAWVAWPVEPFGVNAVHATKKTRQPRRSTAWPQTCLRLRPGCMVVVGRSVDRRRGSADGFHERNHSGDWHT